MKKFILKLLCLFIFIHWTINIKEANALIPYYYLPSEKNLKDNGLSMGKTAYQLLYFGQIKESLNLAKLAVKIFRSNEKLWLILSEAQLANNLNQEALISLNNAQKIKPDLSEIYFAKSNIFLKMSELKKAKISLKKGLKFDPSNHKAIFQLGNIFLLEKDFLSANIYFDKAIKIKPDFWQALNNKGLAYFEQNKISLSIKFFRKAISIEENAEPMLGLASSLAFEDINTALKLAKEALKKDPNYVDYKYRKEQLWGEKLQNRTENLLKNKELIEEIKEAKSKNNKYDP